MRCANPQSRHCLRDPIAAQVSSVPPRILQLAASSQKPPSHRPLRRSCVARPRMQFELLSSDCAKASNSLFGNSGAAASRLALCFGSLAACSRFCSAGIRSPRTGLGPFGSCSGTLSFGEIGSCEFLVVDLLGLVFSQRYDHGYAPYSLRGTLIEQFLK